MIAEVAMRWLQRLALVAVTLVSVVSCSGPVAPVLQPAQWNFGSIAATSPVEREVQVANPGRRPLEVRFISTCTCLTIQPARLELAARGSATVLVRYDPSEDEGEIAMQVIVRSGSGTGKAAARQVLRAVGLVLPGASTASPAGESQPRATAQSPRLFFEYFYDPGCQGCEIFLARRMIALQQELGIRLRAERKDIRKPEIHQEYLRRLEELGAEERGYPAVVFADVVLQGDEEIEREFKKVLQRQLDLPLEASDR